MTSSSSSFVSPALDSVCTSLADICADHYRHSPFDLPRRFPGFAERLQLSLTHLTRATSSFDSLPPSAPPSRASPSTSPPHSKLCRSTEPRAKSPSSSTASPSATAQSPYLAGSPSSTPYSGPQLDLSRGMKQAYFTVTEKQERVHHTLIEDQQSSGERDNHGLSPSAGDRH